MRQNRLFCWPAAFFLLFVFCLPAWSLDLAATTIQILDQVWLISPAWADSPAWAAVLEIGKPVPNFVLTDMNDNQVSLDSYFDRKLTVLVFWTTWSDKSHDELKMLERLYRDKKKSDLAVLAVNLDKEGIDKACLYADQWEISYPILADEKLTTLEKFQVLVIPTVLLIGQGGILKDIQVDYDKETPAVLKEKIAKILSESAQNKRPKISGRRPKV